MADIARLLFRFFAIGFGFFMGCLSAALAYIFLTRLVVPEDFGRFSDLELTVTLAVGVLGVGSLFARAVLLPAFLVIALFEFSRRRDWLSHALAAAMLALGIAGLPLFSGQTAGPAADIEPAYLIAVRVACAIIGATVYWMVTGRNAGRWLPSERNGGTAGNPG